MPFCFGLKEFAFVTSLRCNPPKKLPISKGTPRKKSKERKCKEKIDGRFDIARLGYKTSDLLTDLRDKTIPKKYREKLCLFWYTHLVILSRYVNKVIQDDLLAHAEDFDKFNNYSWGYDSFYLIVQYLLTKLSSGTTTLYSFPKAFMVMDYPDEVSHPRMSRWLDAKNNTKIKESDLFNPLDNAVVHAWIAPTDQELRMTSFITLGHIDTITNPMVVLIEKELAGATAIRRAVRKRQLAHPESYDAADRIMDLDFYNKIKATDGVVPQLEEALMKKSWDFKIKTKA
ncbi:hypothetical protein FXO38_01597 [Capsicum annuum]|nr:hypothetical protein FXO38_01597 [Capsicum annuum]